MSEVGVVRRRRSRAEAAALVADLQRVDCRGKSSAARGLAAGTLDKYRRRLHGGLRSVAGPMIPVEVAPSPKRAAMSRRKAHGG
jgi:hypothetical protein